jgi:hypothetical protein
LRRSLRAPSAPCRSATGSGCRRRHARAVGDEHVGRVVQLVEAVDHRLLRTAPIRAVPISWITAPGSASR